MTDINLAMVLSLKDKLVAPLGRAVDQVERSFKNLDQQAARTARSSATVAENLGKMGRTANATRQATQEMRNLANESERAQRNVSKLTQVAQGLRSLMSGMTKGVAGAFAFSHVVADPLRQAADYDKSLRQLANTAYAGRSLQERRSGMGGLNAAITAAVRTGGGTREQALAALQAMIGGGQFGDPGDAMKALPMVMRAATASGGDAAELVGILAKAKANMGISSISDMQELLDRAISAGNAGGFELKDMAKYLPTQMGMARDAGLHGMRGLTTLLAANQAAVITAGSTDEAGNNLANLLQKINADDTAHNFKKEFGVDLTGSLAYGNSRGLDSLQGFVRAVESVVASDSRYAKAKAAAMAATGPEKKAALDAQVALFQGSAIGRVVPDRQALMALVALMGNKQYMDDVTKQINGSKGAVNNAASFMMEGAGYVYDQRNFEVQKAQTDSMTQANSAVMKLAEAQIDLYQRYPGFASALEATKVAATGAAAALAGVGAASLLTGGARAAAGATAGATATRAAATAGIGALSLGGMAAVAAPALAAINDNRPFVETAADPSIIGSADMSQALTVNVHLDGRQIEAAVTTRQDNRARRN